MKRTLLLIAETLTSEIKRLELEDYHEPLDEIEIDAKTDDDSISLNCPTRRSRDEPSRSFLMCTLVTSIQTLLDRLPDQTAVVDPEQQFLSIDVNIT